MTPRFRAREVALQLLFQYDFNPGLTRRVVERFARGRMTLWKSDPFCLTLYDGVVAHRVAIDKTLATVAENWRLSRMAAIDRNILRMGTFEIVHLPEPTPGPVALNEAIEMARRYGSADSPGFVNGVLDRVFRMQAGEKPPKPDKGGKTPPAGP